MQFAKVDIETIKEIYPHWMYLRKSNDGEFVIIHKETLDKYRPKVNNLMLNEIEEESKYPFPLATGDEINNMDEFKSNDSIQ